MTRQGGPKTLPAAFWQANVVRRLLQLNTGATAGRRATDAIQESNRYAIGKGQKPGKSEVTRASSVGGDIPFKGVGG
jgi:hypothetical protein